VKFLHCPKIWYKTSFKLYLGFLFLGSWSLDLHDFPSPIVLIRVFMHYLMNLNMLFFLIYLLFIVIDVSFLLHLDSCECTFIIKTNVRYFYFIIEIKSLVVFENLNLDNACVSSLNCYWLLLVDITIFI